MKTKWTALAFTTGLILSTVAQEAASGQPLQISQTGQTTSATSGGGARSGGGVRSGGGGGFGGTSAFGGASAANTSSGGATYSTRLAGVLNRVGSNPLNNSVLYFEPGSEKQLAEMNEDLQVLEYVIGRSLDRAFGERTTDYRLGVPMLVTGDGRPVQANYIQGFGVLIKISAPFQVAATGEEPEKRKETAGATSEWEKAQRALRGGGGDPYADETNVAAPYDVALVANLKRQIFESLKNASNLRHLKNDEWVSVAVIGAGPARGGSAMNEAMAARYGISTGDTMSSPGASSILTIRLKKSAAAGAVEELEKSAQVNAYMDVSSIRRTPRATSTTTLR